MRKFFRLFARFMLYWRKLLKNLQKTQRLQWVRLMDCTLNYCAFHFIIAGKIMISNVSRDFVVLDVRQIEIAKKGFVHLLEFSNCSKQHAGWYVFLKNEQKSIKLEIFLDLQ